MTPDRYQRVKAVFHSALELAPEQREAFLAENCADDETLSNEVRSLLSAHDEAESFIETPAAAANVMFANDADLVGKRVGPYRLIRELSQGGMGTVWLAVRADDQFQKRVAIKLIKRGMDSDFILRRFRHERQILASLDHPNIARLLDGGTTEEGPPYFVMEYVEGQPITLWCDRHRLTLAERLTLFHTVCSAVHYAHQNLIIHRDIKPGNILVTADGVPKLLDFGIAKLLNPDLSGATLDPTATALRLMTPEYASPEQARGEPVTTATDVYSLGVLLYELLTSQRPYRFTSTSPTEIERVICETEPVRPSTAATTKERRDGEKEREGEETTKKAGEMAAAEKGKQDSQRQAVPAHSPHRPLSSPPRLSVVSSLHPPVAASQLKGDLDNIVLMALRKEPQRRYASVEQFAADISRYLKHLPVRARKDTPGYRVEKFVRRHRVGVAAATLVLLTLLGGLITTIWQARLARQERARAEQLLGDVRHLTNSFLFEFHDAIEKLPGATPARELIVKRALEYLDRLAQAGSDDVSLQLELAAAYGRLGNIQWARYYANLGDLTGALQSQQKALAIRQKVVAAAPDNENARRALGYSYLLVGDALAASDKLTDAISHYQQSLAVRQALTATSSAGKEDQTSLAISHQRLGDTLGNPGFANLGDWQGALEHYQQMQAIFEKMAAGPQATPDDHHSLGIGYEKLGRVMAAQGDYEGALGFYRQELAVFQHDYASMPGNVNYHRDLAVGFGNVGEALTQAGRHDEALTSYGEALAIRQQLADADLRNIGARRDLALAQAAIAGVLTAKGNQAAALEHYRRALTAFEEVYAADTGNGWIRQRLLATLGDLAALSGRMQQSGQALTYAARQLALQKERADKSGASAGELNDYAWSLLTIEPESLRNPAAALVRAQQAVALSEGKDAVILDTLAHAYFLTGDQSRAVATEEKALALLPADSPARQEAEAALTRFRAAVGNSSAAK